jgi:hypothetical protein
MGQPQDDFLSRLLQTLAESLDVREILPVRAVIVALAIAAAGTLPGCSQNSKTSWEIVPGKRLGALNLSGSERDLGAAYGAQNLRHVTVSLGEGEAVSGTLLYSEDPEKRVEIVWMNATARRYPMHAILRGTRSRWTLPRGITLGTTLAELERLNGRPFTMAGFGWDYSGAVTDWEGGALSILKGRAWLYLEPASGKDQDPNVAQVQGDRDISSTLPAMRALEPRITRIRVFLVEPRRN